MRELEIDCPECQGWIVVDAASGRVLRHGGKGTSRNDPAKKAPRDFDDAFSRVQERQARGDETFDRAVRDVESAEERLQRAFDEAREKAKKAKDDDARHPFDRRFD